MGVPDTLRPKSLVAATPDLGSFLDTALPDNRPVSPAPAWAPRSASRRKRRSFGRRPDAVPWWTLGVGAVVAVVVVFLTLGVDGAYRADHDYWAAYSSLKQPAPGSTAAAERGEQADSGGGDLLRRPQTCLHLEPLGTELPRQ